MIFVFILFAFGQHQPPTGCVIDQCDDKTCTVETPEGWVEVPRKYDYYEGKEVICPLWLIEPT